MMTRDADRLTIFADTLRLADWTSALLAAYNPTGSTDISYDAAKAALASDIEALSPDPVEAEPVALPEDVSARLRKAGFRADRFKNCPHFFHTGPGYEVCSNCGVTGHDLSVVTAFYASDPAMVVVPRPDPIAHATTSPGPVNCTTRLRLQNKPYPRTCERCCLGPCPFFDNEGNVRLASAPGGNNG